MKHLLFVSLLIHCLTTTASAQKSSIDTSALGKWPAISDVQISSNGNYTLYVESNKWLNIKTLCIQSNISDWKIRISSAAFGNIGFSADSKRVCFTKSKDSLGVVTLGGSSIRYTPGILSFRLSGNTDRERMACLTSATPRQLTVTSGAAGKPVIFSHVRNYLFSTDGDLLLIHSDSAGSTDKAQALDLFRFSSRQTTRIWEGSSARNYSFDKQSRQLAFTATDKSGSGITYSIFHYRDGMKKAMPVITNKSVQADQALMVANDEFFFSRDGNKILFPLKKPATPPVFRNSGVGASVDVWHYKDPYLQSEQPDWDFSNFWGILNLDSNKIVWVSNQREIVLNPTTFDNYVLGLTQQPRISFYDTSYKLSPFSVSAITGNKHAFGKENIIDLQLSPDDRFVLWFDADSLHFFSYEIASGMTRNISRTIPVPLYDAAAVAIGRRYSSFDVDGWDPESHAVFLYDRYDIWKVDLQGRTAPVNITNRFGRKNNIVFTLASLTPTAAEDVIRPGQSLLLMGYRPADKFNGFWQGSNNSGSDPVMSTMESCSYFVPRTGAIGRVEKASGYRPLKAKNAGRFVVRRMTAAEFPNLYTTTDFKSFRQVSDLHPETKYNWMKAELITWKMTDGQPSQGILYKPEDFDSTKKYPLIFDYYEKRSDELNQYLLPEFSRDRINIPYYVSSGYLVFVPDIYYHQGHNGSGVVNAVVSAAQYLSKFPWVDSTKLGLQGHSFGGWETNFLITHSSCFAAACEASGVSDEISSYDEANADIRHRSYEVGGQGSPYGIGVTPWTAPNLYIENSPVFYLSNVTTPLLIMHGDRDGEVPYAQALEMFQGLRRAGKKVWLLQYEGADHALFGANSIDYTLRMKQFFDHYLKGAPPTLWMTRGIPVADKTFDAGLGPDTSGRQP